MSNNSQWLDRFVVVAALICSLSLGLACVLCGHASEPRVIQATGNVGVVVGHISLP